MFIDVKVIPSVNEGIPNLIKFGGSFYKRMDKPHIFKKMEKEQEEKELQPPNKHGFKEGDEAVVIADTCTKSPHSVSIGTVVTINTNPYKNGKHYARISKYLWEFFKEEDLRPATIQDLRWKDLGRKVGEIRKGDIVRVINGCKGYPKGAIGVVTSNGDDFVGTTEVGNAWVKVIMGTYRTKVELVAPVESVVNLKVGE